MKDKLTVQEALDLQGNEKVIEKGKQVFFEVGTALRDIKHRRLYRVKHSSWESYLDERWGWSRQHADRLIDGAEIVNSTPGGQQLKNEHAARELSEVPSANRAEVLAKAVASPEGATARGIKKAAAISAVAEVKVVRDSVGREIPPNILTFWERAPEIKSLLQSISEVKCRLEKAVEDKDLMFREISNSAISDLDKAYHSIKCGVPFAVCPQCQGHPESQPNNECRLCLGRGLVSKFRWRTVPEETRKMIEKTSNR